jgi:hypothetical protein
MTLTVALAVLAGLVLAALIAHGAWSARRASPKRAEPEPLRVEPSLDAQVPAAAPPPGTAAEVHADAVVAAPDGGPPARPAAVRRTQPRLDALIDALVTLTVEAPVAGDAALAHLPASRRAGSKPFFIEGLNAETAEWELPAAGERYGEFQAGVQLANRSGALNQIEYSEFVQKVQTFAEDIGAMADFPDMLDVVARAKELDAFASPNDAQLTANLRSNGAAWSVGYLQQCAARHGFVAGALPGRLVLPSADDGAPPVLVLAFDAQAALADDSAQAAVREVSLSLDVPQTPESAEPFAAWQQAIRGLAGEMDAAVVDHDGRPITLQHFAGIAVELQALYRRLEQRDLAAGTQAARRLFS